MATIDTHTVIEELIASGTPKKEAEVFVKNFVIKEELSSIEKERSQLATKMDIVKLESSIKDIKVDILKWMIGLFVTMILAIYFMILAIYFK